MIIVRVVFKPNALKLFTNITKFYPDNILDILRKFRDLKTIFLKTMNNNLHQNTHNLPRQNDPKKD